MDRFFYDKIFNIFFPSKCGYCDEITETYSFICKGCKRDIDYNNRCKLCGKHTYLSEDICAECIKKKHYYNKLIFCEEYEGVLKDKIILYKFNNKKYLYHFFTGLLYERLKNETADIIASVPISKKRMRERGYNQSEIIARKLSKYMNIPYKEVLIKEKDTLRQSELKKEERYKNVKNSFKVADISEVKGKEIILIDDVFTTGTTVNECSKALIDKNARKITVATICIAHHLGTR